MAQAVAFDAAQQDAGLDPVALVHVEQRIGQEAARGPFALAEVGGQLQTVLVHRAAPIRRPSAAAPRPSAALRTMLVINPPLAPSSPRRCVSSIQVEKVV